MARGGTAASRDLTEALFVGGGLLVLGLLVMPKAKKRSSSSSSPPPDPRPNGGKPPVPGYHWIDPDAPRRIREIAAPLETVTGMFGFGDLLAAISFLESRGNHNAGSNSGNAARGWFGMRPVSARVEDAGLPASALKNERQSVALAFWYAWRLQPYAAPGQVIDGLAIRRGWAYPFLVNDVDEEKPTPQYPTPGQHARKIRGELGEALRAVGKDPNFMYQPTFTPGFYWPGIQAALTIAGAGGSVA